ncbi:helix-turn-helix transcriptional regulator [Clostridium intestinale]|uniref:helix-turn-helix domain-containing protein n=1 Tax=Clostridium intestinale TaxID=36845 RepID=UPI002DD6A365|nr:helix-turn-helix transcriptional regulator [Clostridium intestinale]WRY49507.1 helix-turn-helix transcriptional regulator [Clostridium intestinale]
MEITEIIYKRRKELNLTYEQLGTIIGVGKSTVRKWESGLIQDIKINNLISLSKALNIPLNQLINHKEYAIDKQSLVLSLEEITLLETFRKLDIDNKQKILTFITSLSFHDNYK